MSLVEGPIAVIERVFEEPKGEEKVVLILDERLKKVLSAVNKSLEEIVYKKRQELGVTSIKPIDLPSEKAGELRQRIKSDKCWLELYKEALSASKLSVAGSLEEQLAAINIPWYIEIVSNMRNAQEDAHGNFLVEMGVAPSYAIQLNRRGLLRGFNPATIEGIILSNNKCVEMGIRAGKTYVDTEINVTAGAIVPDKGIFGSYLKEMKEEAGLVPGDNVEVTGMIGTFYDYKISGPNFVVLTKTDYEPRELVRLWEEKAEERGEHSQIFFKGVEELPNYLLAKADRDRDRTVVKPSTIIPSGVGSLLVLLAHCSQKDCSKALLGLLDFYELK